MKNKNVISLVFPVVFDLMVFHYINISLNREWAKSCLTEYLNFHCMFAMHWIHIKSCHLFNVLSNDSSNLNLSVKSMKLSSLWWALFAPLHCLFSLCITYYLCIVYDRFPTNHSTTVSEFYRSKQILQFKSQ